MGGFVSQIVQAPNVDMTTILDNTAPKPETKTPSAGAMPKASRGDHTHPRLTSATNATLDANGFATVTFTRTFDTEPALALVALGSGTSPIPDFRGDFIITNGVYTGVTIYGQKSRALPVITPLNAGLLSLVSSLIGALNPILASLSGFTPIEPAAGARVSVVAIQNSST